MKLLEELSERLAAGEITRDEMIEYAAAAYVERVTPIYPETDTDVAYLTGVSAATLANAVQNGWITAEDKAAIIAARPGA